VAKAIRVSRQSTHQRRRLRILSVFNNKGGVGKTTLTFHLAHALAELGERVLLVDLDPQCNLTIYNHDTEALHSIWEKEDAFIDDFEASRGRLTQDAFSSLLGESRTIHFLLKPTEEGTGELPTLPPPIHVAQNLDLIPGRLTLHLYEERVAARWSDVYKGDPLAIRTMTRVRTLVAAYAAEYGYTIALIDTSPSLGALNKITISTVDGFLVPCLPDMFSLYGIRNIGSALGTWKREFDTIYRLISESKREQFPSDFVRFLGFTIYNAKKRTGSGMLDMAKAHENYASQIPDTIRSHIPEAVRRDVESVLAEPIGDTAIMHTHNTLPSMAQKYRLPIWMVPSCSHLDAEDRSTILGNRQTYEGTQAKYHAFAQSVLRRADLVTTG
jgi:cellulose biosynthesis protein BcsQ